MTKRVLRLLRILPLALLFAGMASAQTTGTIIGVVTDASTGKPVAGALIIVTSPNLQGEQTAITDNGGNYRVILLPPGDYKLAVQLEGFKPFERSDIRVSIDKTIRANLSVVPEAVQLEEQVVRTGAPVVNVASAEAGAVVSKEFIASVPIIGRSMEDAAIVTPTAIVDEYGFSFAGSQSPETSYVLDGMNVTDPRFGTQGISLLNNFVQELEVKTGNFLPEYGRSTGGVVNVVTKSGSNEFHGSVFMNYNPQNLVQPDGDELGRRNEAIGYQLTPGEGAYEADFGFEVGGPIMKDKLWFYAGFAPVLESETWTRYYKVFDGTNNNRIDGTDQVYEDTVEEYQYTGKLTYLIDENNSVKASVAGLTRSTVDHWAGFNRTPENMQNENGTTDDYVIDLIGSYDGKFMDKKLILNATVGYHRQGNTNPETGTSRSEPTNSYRVAVPGQTFPLELFEPGMPAVCSDPGNRCAVTNYYTGGGDFYEDGSTADRIAGKVSLGYLFDAAGSHNVKGGIDVERTNYNYNRGYSGGGRWFMYDTDEDGAIDYTYMNRGYGLVTNLASDNQADVTYLQTIKSQGVSTSTAFFLQDQWSPMDGLFVNYGLRWELQRLIDEKTDISPDVKINDNIAPRVQVVYDWTKTGRSKVFGSWGRFYEAIPLDMVVRAFGLETSIYESRDISTCAPNSGAPGADAWAPNFTAGCDAIYDGWYNVHGEEALFLQAGTVSPVDPDIKGMYVDQYGVGAEYEILPDFSVGLEYQGRRLGRAIEDMSSNDGVTYFIGNPGEGEPFDYSYPNMAGDLIPIPQDPTGVDTVDALTGVPVRVPFPKAERKYDGITVKARKNFSRNWLMEASYTWSQLVGNYAGLFRPENDQLDPNLTSEYDLPTLMTNRKGYLPGDRTHFFKLYGAYNWDVSQRFNVMTGAAFRAYSGVPINALGAHEIYGGTEAFLVPRGQAGRTEAITKLDLKAGLRYVIKAPYEVAFTVDFFNVLNSKEATAVDEQYTSSFVQGIQGIDCSSRDGANQDSPIEGLQSDCNGIAYMKTLDGRPVAVNSNYGQPTQYAAPFSMRLGLSLTF